MLRAMDLFTDLFNAILVDQQSNDDTVPLQSMITAYACQLNGGIYTKDNISRIVHNMSPMYGMFSVKYSDGSSKYVIRRLQPYRGTLMSYEQNPRINRPTDLVGCKYLKKNWGHVKKRIQKITSM